MVVNATSNNARGKRQDPSLNNQVMTKKQPKKSSETLKNIPQRPDRDRRVRQSMRLARVLRLLSLIQSRGRWDRRSLADALECSERTLYRDLQVLEFAGVPYFCDEQTKCYRVRQDYNFPVRTLSADEARGLAIATNLSSAKGTHISKGALPTTEKVLSASSEQMRKTLIDAMAMIKVLDLQLVDHTKHHDIIQTIQFALMDRKVLSGIYESPYELDERTGKSLSQRLLIHPIRLCLIKRAWYLIGRLDGKPDAITLRVTRFKSLRQLDRKSETPDLFDLEAYFGNAWSVYRGADNYDVELRFSGNAARIVPETTWHSTQVIRRIDSKSISVTYNVDGLNEILNWLLRWSGEVTVMTPEILKTQFRKKLEDALSMNG